MKKLYFASILFLFPLFYQSASGQLLNKVKQRLEDKADQALDNALNGKNKTASGAGSGNESGTGSNGSNGSGRSTGSGAGRARNAGGAGLVSTPPDVKLNLTNAENAFKTGKYGETRYAIQQAMLGVEMEIGQKVLKSLPETISGLKKDEEHDQVTSTGWGWVGLTVQRRYNNADDKELTVMVANNAAWMSAINLYFTNGGAGQTTGGKQNWKQTTLKGNRGVIEYSDDSGYKLSVPIGQASLLVYEGVNFKNEQELMAAANAVDIDGIKKNAGRKISFCLRLYFIN